MTRIIAGSAGGRRLRVPPAGTRPTSDRVREALFNVLDSRLDWPGLRVLDLYAGSGALGLEALSRGAGCATFVESDRRAAAVVAANIAHLGFPDAGLRRASVAAVLLGRCDEPFDVVFSDPPYAMEPSHVADDLSALIDGGWLSPGSCVALERSVRSAPTAWPDGFAAGTARRYGETRIDLAYFGG